MPHPHREILSQWKKEIKKTRREDEFKKFAKSIEKILEDDATKARQAAIKG